VGRHAWATILGVIAPSSRTLGRPHVRCLIGSLALAGLALGCGDNGRKTRHPELTGPPLAVTVDRDAPAEAAPAPVFEILSAELQRNLAALQADDTAEASAYFLAYDLVEAHELWLQAVDGAITKRHLGGDRLLDVDVRVGDRQLDNSHSLGGYGGNGLGSGVAVSLDDDGPALAQALWLITDLQYRDALDAYSEVSAGESMLTREDAPDHPDFSEETPVVHLEPHLDVDLEALRTAWAGPLAEISAHLVDDPLVLDNAVVLQARLENRTYVNSEGTRMQTPRLRLRVMLSASAQADDGMMVERFASYDVHRPDQLPQLDTLVARADELREELVALRSAAVAEPYTGPAVLEGPAAGVFFHEIFGHRLEGHRQKDDLEGQTFTEMIGRSVLPAFIDVVDDPTVARLDGTPLNGQYFVDDEGVPAEPTTLVEGGELRAFLLDRSPVLPFEHSNGHGRREPGHQVVARQGNLIVSSRHTMPEGELRDALIAAAERQGKPYGLWFRDIQGGYTITDRSGPQAFKVLPLIVYRIYTDGRPDELVRGADIVGTPLQAFETIIGTGDRAGIFNGMCGAESGWVPVSAVSPSLLLEKLEIERAVHDRDKPPLLPAPSVQRRPAHGGVQ